MSIIASENVFTYARSLHFIRITLIIRPILAILVALKYQRRVMPRPYGYAQRVIHKSL